MTLPGIYKRLLNPSSGTPGTERTQKTGLACRYEPLGGGIFISNYSKPRAAKQYVNKCHCFSLSSFWMQARLIEIFWILHPFLLMVSYTVVTNLHLPIMADGDYICVYNSSLPVPFVPGMLRWLSKFKEAGSTAGGRRVFLLEWLPTKALHGDFMFPPMVLSTQKKRMNVRASNERLMPHPEWLINLLNHISCHRILEIILDMYKCNVMQQTLGLQQLFMQPIKKKKKF